MESVNVLVTGGVSDIDDECLQQITSVSPKIKLTDVTDFVRAEQRGDFTCKEQLDALLAEAEVIYGFTLPQNLIARAPKLKWLHLRRAGVDRFLTDELVQSSVIITSASGVQATQISEFIFGLMLMFAKNAPLYLQLKQKKQWQRFTSIVLRSKTVGIVGLGHIGGEVARLAKAFGMRVVAVDIKRVRTRYVDIMLSREQLRQLLSDSDFVVLTLPLTAETNKLIGEEELRAMKSTAYLINVARGSIVDEEALIRALDEHWIAGAGLDAFTTEPLPTDSRLWELPNVILSPHCAGAMENVHIRMTELFCENLRRYVTGKKLLNIVDKKKGF